MKAFKLAFFAYLFPWLPKRLLSRVVGILMRVPLGPLSGVLIPPFARFFKIKIEEAELPPSHYRSFDDFFTRKLKAGIRPIQSSAVYPADSVLTEQAVLNQGQLIQAKGWTYEVGEFLGDPEFAKVYAGGSFATYYLCPADYHRVHSSDDGLLISALHIPGALWPVNDWSVNNVERLFNLNERVVLNFESPQGRWALVMVGATNVGYMSFAFDPSLVTKQWTLQPPKSHDYRPGIPIKAGDELGLFHLGSTVICVYDRNFKFTPVKSPLAVKMGESRFQVLFPGHGESSLGKT